MKEEIIHEPIKQQVVPLSNESQETYSTNENSRLSFNDIDQVKTTDGSITSITAPKDLETLEQISQIRNQQRKMDEDDDDNVKLTISDQSFNLDSLDVHNIEEPSIDLLPDLLIDDIEILE